MSLVVRKRMIAREYLLPPSLIRSAMPGKHDFQSGMQAVLRSETYTGASGGNTDRVAAERVRARAQNR
jgi:hypothetical protein